MLKIEAGKPMSAEERMEHLRVLREEDRVALTEMAVALRNKLRDVDVALETMELYLGIPSEEECGHCCTCDGLNTCVC
jgi:hypothetical protein